MKEKTSLLMILLFGVPSIAAVLLSGLKILGKDTQLEDYLLFMMGLYVLVRTNIDYTRHPYIRRIVRYWDVKK